MSYKSKKNGGLILMLIGIGSIVTVFKRIETREVRNADIVLLVSGVILFGIGTYALLRHNNN